MGAARASSMIPLTPTDLEAVASLTPKEREALVLYSKGFTIREVATRLSVTFFTAHDHLKHIYKKLDVGSRAEAAVIAAKAGLV